MESQAAGMRPTRSLRSRRLLAIGLAGAALAAAVFGGAALSRSAEPERETTVLSWTARERVEQRLAQSRALAGTRLRAEGTGGTVAVTGAVRDDLQRDRALRIAAQTPGVREVRDRLRIDSTLPAPAPRPDEDVARDVAQKLSVDSALEARAKRGWTYGWRVEGDGWALDVDVDDGDVLLGGVVLMQPHIHEFILAAREVPGVRSVRSELEIRPNPAPKIPIDQ